MIILISSVSILSPIRRLYEPEAITPKSTLSGTSGNLKIIFLLVMVP
jgi:hypothetical protein